MRRSESIAIEPWRYDGQTVTVIGNFRGRNLFGDLPGAPGKSKYDFVLRGTEGAVWVTDLRPRGQGFDLDINRRVDTDRWLEVTGTVVRDKALVSLKATRDVARQALRTAPVGRTQRSAVPLAPVEVVFNSPTDGETDVSGAAPIRIQFSRGLNQSSLCRQHPRELCGQRSKAGSSSSRPTTRPIAQSKSPSRSRSRRSEPFSVELLEGLKGFDGAPIKPWTVTFSVGG